MVKTSVALSFSISLFYFITFKIIGIPPASLFTKEFSDSLDKSHLIKTYEFLQQKLIDGFQFQYITTINEGGFVGKNFGSSDVIDPARMKKEAKKNYKP